MKTINGVATSAIIFNTNTTEHSSDDYVDFDAPIPIIRKGVIFSRTDEAPFAYRNIEKTERRI